MLVSKFQNSRNYFLKCRNPSRTVYFKNPWFLFAPTCAWFITWLFIPLGKVGEFCTKRPKFSDGRTVVPPKTILYLPEYDFGGSFCDGCGGINVYER